MRGITTLSLLSGALAFALACSSTPNNDDDGGGAGGTTSAGGGGALPDPKPLKVVTWNVKNLVDDQDDGEMFEEQDFQWESHVSDVANVLNAIDADVIVLQEVEHTTILGAVVSELTGSYPFHQVIDANDPRGIDVGLISKLEPDDVITHRGDNFSVVGTDEPTFRYARDALEIRLTFNGRKLAFFGVHYKSKESDDPQKRLAEAQHTRKLADIVTEDDPSAGVLILGDFNDLPGSPPLDFSIGNDPAYVAIADNVAQGDRWTFNFQGTLELVDHQIANPLLAGKLNTSSVEILHGPEVEAASDHAPLVATYDIN